MIELLKKLLGIKSPSEVMIKETNRQLGEVGIIRCNKKVIVVNGEIICIDANDALEIFERFKEG